MNFSAPGSRLLASPAPSTRVLQITLGLLLVVVLGSTTPRDGPAPDAAAPSPPVDALIAGAAEPIERAAPGPDRGSPSGSDRAPARAYGPAALVSDHGSALASDHDSALVSDHDSALVSDHAPQVLLRSEPVRVRIPAIGVDGGLVDLGLQQDGRMEVPPGAFPAGWFTGAPTPGELGPAVFAGHVDYDGAAGVFARLLDLRPGDRVEVDRRDGGTVTFLVTRVEQHPKDAFPTAAVYGDIDHAGLRLITCGGQFDRSVRSYEDNIVVFAELA